MRIVKIDPFYIGFIVGFFAALLLCGVVVLIGGF
jgi:hypothetical protein